MSPTENSLPNLTEPLTVVAIVVTYNGKKWLDKCLGSLLHGDIKIRTIVVDNGSTDGSQAYIQENYPEVEFVQSEENLGFGKANNIGLEKAKLMKADYVFLLNQDAWISPDCVPKLIEAQRQSPEYGILSPIQYNGDGSDLDFKFHRFLGGASGLLMDLLSTDRSLKDIYDIPFVNAAMWLISKKALQDLIGFDQIFDHYGEDDDMIARAVSLGYRIGVCPHAAGWHDRPQMEAVRFRNDCVNWLYTRDLVYLMTKPRPFASTRMGLAFYCLKRLIADLLRSNRLRQCRSILFVQVSLWWKLNQRWSKIRDALALRKPVS